MKIDVQGFEEHVLAGAVQVLTGAAGGLVVREEHDERLIRNAGGDVGAAAALLTSLGYVHERDVVEDRVWVKAVRGA